MKIKNLILDTLFPVSCLSCGLPDTWLCKTCLEKIPLRRDQVCPLCEERITPSGATCFGCRSRFSIDGLLVAASYQEKLISKLVHLFKYRFIDSLSEPLGRILAKAIYDSEIPVPDLIIPVPLHPRRLRWRGFNQSRLLGEYLSQNLTPGFAIPIPDNLIVRQKYTIPQMSVKNFAQRQKNIRDAFRIVKNRRKAIADKNILLVDDIATTGATLLECARLLKKAGARSVFGAVVARQELGKN